jgi:hypothetical protein
MHFLNVIYTNLTVSITNNNKNKSIINEKNINIHITIIRFRNPVPAITDFTPIKWLPLKKGNVYNYLNIDIQPRMEIFHKGQQRWDWENIKNKL